MSDTMASGKMLSGDKKQQSRQLVALVDDAKRFILQNWSILDVAPSQLYFSALLFAPQSSIVKQSFEASMELPIICHAQAPST